MTWQGHFKICLSLTLPYFAKEGRTRSSASNYFCFVVQYLFLPRQRVTVPSIYKAKISVVQKTVCVLSWKLVITVWKLNEDWWEGGNCVAKFQSFMFVFCVSYGAVSTGGLDRKSSMDCLCVWENECLSCREWSALTCRGCGACAPPAAWSRAWCSPSSRASTSSTTSWTKPCVTLHSPASSTTTSCGVLEDLVGWVILSRWFY